MTAAKFKRGDWVVYVPGHAHGDITHPDCERGSVSSVNAAGTVFVFYGQDLHAKGTEASDLITADEFFKPKDRPIGRPGGSHHRTYLGDGLFADFDGIQTVLSAEDGLRAHDVVYLEPSVYAALLRWHKERIAPLYEQITEG